MSTIDALESMFWTAVTINVWLGLAVLGIAILRFVDIVWRRGWV